MFRLATNAALGVALVLALAGPWLVAEAFDAAGGTDRDRPQVGLLHRELGCVESAPGEPHMVVPSRSCPTVMPRGLSDEYRAAWMGFWIALAGMALALAVVARPSVRRRRAYLVLGLAAAWSVLVAVGISDWFRFDLTGLGSEPPERDAFDRIAIGLVVVGLALVPVGIVLRRLFKRPGAGEPVGAN